MTENLPAVQDHDLERFRTVGYWLSLSESGENTPKATGASAALRLYYAEQLGLPPLAAQELSVIKGRLVVSAQLLRALAEREGYRVVRTESTDQTCTAQLVDVNTGQLLGEATYTIEMAKTAGLVRDRSAWISHPARMLWARASKNVIVDYAPAVALGMILDDEGREMTGHVIAEEEDIDWPDDTSVEEAAFSHKVASEIPANSDKVST